MKISAQLTFWFSLAFAVLCLCYAFFGFSSIDATMSEETQDASRGYAWFWTLLGAVGLALAALARRMAKDLPDDDG